MRTTSDEEYAGLVDTLLERIRAATDQIFGKEAPPLVIGVLNPHTSMVTVVSNIDTENIPAALDDMFDAVHSVEHIAGLADLSVVGSETGTELANVEAADDEENED